MLKKPLIIFLVVYLVIASVIFVRNLKHEDSIKSYDEVQADNSDRVQENNDASLNAEEDLGGYFSLEPLTHLSSNTASFKAKKHEEAVLMRGQVGEWDSVDLLNPSVIKRDNKYYNYYSGYDGSVWQTGLATSDDGIHWTKYVNNPVLKLGTNGQWDDSFIAANGSALQLNNKVYYYYQGTSSLDHKANIGLATSDNGMQFTKETSPVLTIGAEHSWDSDGVADPYVIEHKSYLYMYYLGMDEMKVQRLGVARSKDGLVWEKSIVNPILDVGAKGSFDENGLGEPSVYYEAPYFYMVYTGRDAGEKRDIGLAVSLDGLHWKKQNYSGLFADRKPGTWDDSVICDTTFLFDSDKNTLLMWYGGGNKPLPAQGLNGQVGLIEVSIDQGRSLSEFDPNVLSDQSVVNSQDILQGSYAIEGEPSKKSVWMNKEGRIALRSKGSGRLEISGFMPFTAHQNSDSSIAAVSLTVKINGNPVETKIFSDDIGFTVSIEKEKYARLLDDSGYLHVELSCSSSFVPLQSGGSVDERELAYILNKISVN